VLLGPTNLNSQINIFSCAWHWQWDRVFELTY
jgi:hypothetical protein